MSTATLGDVKERMGVTDRQKNRQTDDQAILP